MQHHGKSFFSATEISCTMSGSDPKASDAQVLKTVPLVHHDQPGRDLRSTH